MPTRARAGQIAATGGWPSGPGCWAVAALGIGLGTATLVGGSGGQHRGGVGRGGGRRVDVPVDPGATVTVRLMNADGSFSGQADAKRYGPV